MIHNPNSFEYKISTECVETELFAREELELKVLKLPVKGIMDVKAFQGEEILDLKLCVYQLGMFSSWK